MASSATEDSAGRGGNTAAEAPSAERRMAAAAVPTTKATVTTIPAATLTADRPPTIVRITSIVVIAMVMMCRRRCRIVHCVGGFERGAGDDNVPLLRAGDGGCGRGGGIVCLPLPTSAGEGVKSGGVAALQR